MRLTVVVTVLLSLWGQRGFAQRNSTQCASNITCGGFVGAQCPAGRTCQYPTSSTLGCCSVKLPTVCGNLTAVNEVLDGRQCQINIKGDDKTNSAVLCSSFWGAMQCLMKELITDDKKMEDCKYDLKHLIKRHHSMLAAKVIGESYNRRWNASQCTEFWDESCPAYSQGTFDLCSRRGMCSADGKCNDTQSCCSTVCGEKCLPDLKKCIDINYLINTVITDSTCLPSFIALTAETLTLDMYCSNFWGGLTCLADMIGMEYKDHCLERMAKLVLLDPTRILSSIKLALETIPFNEKWMNQSAMCKENPLKPKEPPVIVDDVEPCLNQSKLKRSLIGCKKLSSFSNQYSTTECSAFKEMVMCMAKNITRDKENDRRKCVYQIQALYERGGPIVSALTPLMRNFKPSKCIEKENVCGNKDMPLDAFSCPRQPCPRPYVCKRGYCCPQQKEGSCPSRFSKNICGLKCMADSDCNGDDNKCCDIGCGNKTCAKSVKMELSQCEKEYKRSKERLEMTGACGDGVSYMSVTKCQGKKHFPSQIKNEMTGEMYCVDEQGNKIPGSDHQGNVDCTKVKPGRCPSEPSQCETTIDNCKKNDDEKCGDGQKCCLTRKPDSNICIRQCTTAQEVGENDIIADTCTKGRSCCNIAMCESKKCLADVSAICRINSCGGCSVDFYNASNEIVDCDEGVTLCVKQREEARQANTVNNPNRIKEIIEGRSPSQSKKYNFGEDDDEQRKEYDDEYDDRKEESDNDQEKDMSEMDVDGVSGCALIVKYDLCKNGATCAFNKEENEDCFKLCDCKPGYRGLFCESKEPETRNSITDSECGRRNERIDTLMQILQKSSAMSAILRVLIKSHKSKCNILPQSFACDANGNFKSVQIGLIIGNLYKYCVEPETGNRKPYTDVILESAGTKPDCSKEREVEIMKLPGKCLHQKVAEQSASKEESSRFYYNNADRQCVSGSASGKMSGFYSANDCYQTCGYFTDYKCPAVPDGTVGTCVEACQDCDKGQLCCSNGCGHVCTSAAKSEFTPLPCEKDTSCNYKKQYCDAESRKCAAYPQHCIEDPRPGDGNIRIKAFYFNVTLHMCMPFVYMGNGGNENRFDTIHQCQTECAPRAYKNKGAVCPNPRALASHPSKDMQEDNCHGDYSCDGNEVCCSTTFSTVCSAPIESPCLNGNRCAPYGFCENNKCMCELTRCTNDPSSKVCGSDGKTYNNTCLLKYTACRTWRLIFVVSRGECDEKLPDESRKCPIACTKDYRPVCAYDKTDKPKLVEYSNPCVMKDAVQCNKADSHLLYNGFCKRECGNNTCEIYENCVDNKCGCPSFCTEDYRPVCGHPIGFSAEARHFDNECHLRKYGCEKKEIFVISSMDKCANSEPVHECPPTRHNIPKSADHGCGLDNDDKYCNKTTERCCPVGAGTRCISKRLLIRKVTVKDGSCPMSAPLKDIYEKCDANIKCSADDDCRANAKCCQKQGCPHGVCTMPVGLPSLGECGTDQEPVNGILCDPSAKEHFCTDGATCTTVDRDGQQYGVCCKSKNSLPADKEAIMKAKVCQTLYAMGVKCLNGGKCIGDLKNRQICKCTTPYKGAFCNKTTETSKCETQQQIWRVLYHKMKTTCEKKMDDNDSAEKETERADKDTTKEERRKRDEDDMPQKEHRDDDDDTPQKEHREDSEREMECSFAKGDILVSHLIKLLKMMGLPMIYNKGEVACTNSGTTLFKQAQCFKRLQGNDVYCQCVDKNTGMPVPNSPKGRTAAEIDCSITEFPKVCLKMPDLTKCSNGGATTRWYFNASLGFCQNTTCSIGDEGNNFEDYNTCNSVCFSNAVYSGEGCSRVRCRANTECRTMNGETKCHDISGGPKGGMGQFEPRCTAAGTFEVKQCHGDACRCVDPTTGVSIPGSTAHARVLQCVDNNGKIDVQIDDRSANVCKDGANIMFCERGGNVCDNCTKTKAGEDGRGGNPPKERDHGVCDTCKTCPGGGKLKLCEKTCNKNDMCPGFVEAICRVNRCTCALEFVDSNNAVVNCSKVKAQCERQKHNLKIEERARQYNTSGKPSESQTQIKCTPSGTYEAICSGGSCYCLNASNGEKVSKTKTNKNIDAIDCSKTQSETNPVSATVMFKVSERELDSLSDKEKKAFLVGVKKFVSKRVSVKKHKLMKGSVYYEAVCEKLSQSSDLMSDLNSIVQEINTGQAAIIVDGESVVLSEAEVVNFMTSSELVQPTTTETTPPEDNDVVIIVVVVVVVIVLLLAVLIGCYCYRKSRTSKENGTEFSNIHGQSNPTYKHA